jgi:WD40 repeat protein
MIDLRKAARILKYLLLLLVIVVVITPVYHDYFLGPEPFLKLPPGHYAVYSPDGALIVVTRGGGPDYETYPAAYIIDASNGTKLAELDPSYETHKAAFSPDGRYLVTATDVGLDVWDTTTWQHMTSYHDVNLTCDFDYSPDRALLILGICGPSGGYVAVVDANSGEKLEGLLSYYYGFPHLAYSPDGNYIALAIDLSSDEGVLYVWDARTYRELYHFNQIKDVTDIAWSPDGRMIATTTRDGLLRIHDITLGKRVKELKLSGILRSVTYSPDGHFIAVGGEHPTTIYDTTTWKKVGGLGRWDVTSIRYSPDGNSVVPTHGCCDETTTFVFKTSDILPRSGGTKGFLDRLFSTFEQ